MNQNITITGIGSRVREYTGLPVTFPDLQVTYKDTPLVRDTDYTEHYYNNIQPGIGVLLLKGAGDYDFAEHIYFTVYIPFEDTTADIRRIAILNDLDMEQLPVIKEHDARIEKEQYNSAIALLNQNPQIDGFRAKTFRAMEETIKETQEYLTSKHAPSYYYTSPTEPSEAAMEGNVYWMQEYV